MDTVRKALPDMPPAALKCLEAFLDLNWGSTISFPDFQQAIKNFMSSIETAKQRQTAGRGLGEAVRARLEGEGQLISCPDPQLKIIACSHCIICCS